MFYQYDMFILLGINLQLQHKQQHSPSRFNFISSYIRKDNKIQSSNTLYNMYMPVHILQNCPHLL